MDEMIFYKKVLKNLFKKIIGHLKIAYNDPVMKVEQSKQLAQRLNE